MLEIGSYEAKTHLSSLLDEVQLGKSFVITRHGRPVAVLAPPEGDQMVPATRVIADLRALRSGVRLAGLRLQDLIEEGRR